MQRHEVWPLGKRDLQSPRTHHQQLQRRPQGLRGVFARARFSPKLKQGLRAAIAALLCYTLALLGQTSRSKLALSRKAAGVGRTSARASLSQQVSVRRPAGPPAPCCRLPQRSFQKFQRIKNTYPGLFERWSTWSTWLHSVAFALHRVGPERERRDLPCSLTRHVARTREPRTAYWVPLVASACPHSPAGAWNLTCSSTINLQSIACSLTLLLGCRPRPVLRHGQRASAPSTLAV